MSSRITTAVDLIWLGGSALALITCLAALFLVVINWKKPGRPRYIRLCVGSLLTLVALFALYISLVWGVFVPMMQREVVRQQKEALEAKALVHVGDAAPPFQVADVDGNEFTLSNSSQDVVLINFFATWCGPCLEELPLLQSVWDKNSDEERFSMLVIGREETSEAVSSFRSKYKFTFPMAADPHGMIYHRYAESLIPRTFLIAPGGQICYSSAGFDEKDIDDLQAAIADQLRQGGP